MSKVKSWLQAARLRTLPLSVSGIILGSFLASTQIPNFSWGICVFALLTTIGFQVLSNFANDYGDGVKGTDNEDRVGPKRALQSGAILPNEMLKGIKITIALTLFVAIYLIYLSFGLDNLGYALLFLALGIASIVAAMKYTMGKSAYGYHGLGDVFVFLFFGLLSVCGTYFLYTHTLHLQIFLPAIAVGALSAAVLNLNNLRDRISDQKSNKNTLVVKLGEAAAKRYHYYLLIMAFVASLVYTIDHYTSPIQWMYLIAFVPLAIHFVKVLKNTDTRLLDPELKKVALSTFLYAILFGLGNFLA